VILRRHAPPARRRSADHRRPSPSGAASEPYDAPLGLETAVLAHLADTVIVVRAKDGSIVYANAAAERFFGHRPSGLVGRHVSCLAAVTDAPARRAREIAAAVADGGVWAGDVEAVRKDGTRFWSSMRVSGLEDPEHGSLWIAVHSASGKRLAAERGRRDAETRFRTVFDSGPTPMVLVGPDLCVLDANPVACALTGFARDELVGRSLAHVTHPDDVAVGAEPARRLFAGTLREYRAEKRLVTRDGETVAVALTTTAVPDADGRAAYAIVMVDVVNAATAPATPPARGAAC
jgi:PAS domain S-box-containing protein